MYILLDIDGVMIPIKSWKSVELLEDNFLTFNSIAVSNINRMIIETNATIILTSSHKSLFNLEQWNKIFYVRGIDTVIGKLEDNIHFLTRKEEILKWLHKNSKENVVIIDDDKSLNSLPLHLKNKWVPIDSMIGLTEKNTSDAINILKNNFV